MSDSDYPKPKDGEFPEALAWLLAKTSVTPDEFAKLSEDAQRKAFKVAGVAELDVVNDVLHALEAAIQDGDDLDDFKARVGPALLAAWQGTVDDPAWRIETIMRTNLQGAYAAGRFSRATDEEVLEDRPFWRFDAIVDGRETRVCNEADGTILPTDHEWWKSHHPPLHFNCRSVVTSLTPEEAHAAGVTTAPTERPAAKGFGKLPTAANEWAPDLGKYPEDLQQQASERTGVPSKSNPKPRKKKPKATHDPAHWQVQLQEKYGDAAPAVAWGYAAYERGLDMQLADVKTSVEWVLRGKGADILRNLEAKPGTIRALLKDEALNTEQREALELAAVLAGHVERITPHKKLQSISKKLPKKAIDKAMAQMQFDAETLWLRRMLDQKVPHAASVKWANKRPGCRGTEITSNFRNPGAIIHEWGHALEFQSEKARKRAFAFLEARTVGETDQPLSALTGSPEYEPHEVARPDHFFRPYVGRSYRDANGAILGSEITSMGLEELFKGYYTDDKDLIQKSLLTQDKEHLFFVLGQLAGL